MNGLKLGTCGPMRAQISEKQCRFNRNRGCFSCTNCKGLEGTALVNATLPIVADKKGVAVPSGKGDCPTCGRKDVAMVHKDKCARCVDRVKKGKDPVTGLLYVQDGLVKTVVEDATMPGILPLLTESPMDRLNGLLAAPEPQGLFIPLDANIMARVEEQELTLDDIRDLIGHLLDGKLQWRM